MSEKKIVLPEELERAARNAYAAWHANCRPEDDMTNGAVAVARAVARWLTENPMVPTEEFLKNWPPMERVWVGSQCVEWQRHMFDEPEPEVPEAVKDLLWASVEHETMWPNDHNKAIIEAYRRGQESKT